MSSKTVYEDDLEIVGTTTTNNLTVTGVLNATADFPSVLTSTNTTASTSNSTGGVLLSGGMGISNTTDAVDSTNGGTITTAGGAAIAKKLFVGNSLVVGTDTSAITPLASTRLYIVGNTTDSPLVSGLGFQRSGASINSTGINTTNEMVFSLQSAANFKFQTGQSDYNVAGTVGMTIGTTQISTTIATESSSSVTGSFITAGGAGIAKKLYVGTDLSVGGNITSGAWNAGVIAATYGGTGAATLTSNAVLLGNGTGVIQSPSTITYATSTLTLPKIISNDVTDSSSSITGAVTIAGGLGIAKKLYVGTNLFTGSNVGIGTSTANAPLQFANDAPNRKIVLWEGANDDHQFYGFGINSFTLRYQVSATTDSHVFYAATSSSTSNEIGRILGSGGSQFPLVQGGSTASAILTLRSTTNATKGYIHLDETTESSSITSGALRIDGGVGVAKKLFVGGGEINLTNGTSNIIVHGAGGGAPAQTTRSVGTKIVLNSGVTATSLDHAIGIESQNMWFSVPNGAGGDGFKWYTGNAVTNVMRLGSTQLNLAVATESSSSITGSFITAGGVGIAKKLYVGTDLAVGGTVTLTTALSVANGGTGATTSTGTGAVVLATAPSLLTSLNVTNGANSFIYNGLGISSTRASGASNVSLISSTSGFSSYDVYTNSVNNTWFYSGLDGNGFSGINSGGGLIATSGGNPNKSIMIAPAFANMMTIDTSGVDIVGATASTSNSTGILKLAGGIGISNTTEATSSTNGGTITTAGGAAIAKKLFVGGDLSVTGSIITPAIGKMSPVYIRGSGVNNLVNQLVKVGGTTHVNTSNVGLTLTIINAATHALTSTTAYDTSTSGAASTSLATAIDNLDRQQICILTSYSSFTGAMNAALRTSARRLGLYKLAETTTVSTAYCSIFKGQGTGDPNTGKNNQVVEYLSDAAATSDFATIAAWIIDDSISIDTLPSSLVNPSPISTIPAVYVNNSGYVGINTITPTSNLQIEGTTGSTSSTSGSVLMNGGLGISNNTDAISSTNGGTITTAGGAAIAKKLFVGTDLTIAGSIGIGTPATTYRFDLDNAGICARFKGSSIDSTVIRYENTSTGGRTYHIGSTGTGSGAGTGYSIFDVTSSAARLLIDASGDVNIYSTTGSTSSITGALKLSGGIGISNTTDATSIVNGGTITTAGGASIAKKLYVGGGEINLGNNTSNWLQYNIAGVAAPSYTTRSAGTKLVLYDSLSGSGLDFAIGIEADCMWSSVFKSGDLFKWYFGSTSPGMTLSDNQLSIASTAGSTSSITGALKLSGGIGISNNTDATSSTNGGSITTAGGAAVAKKLYVGGGEINLGNNTSNWTQYNTAGVAAPSFTTRSVGTKLVLYNGLSGVALDFAIGVEGGSMWSSASGVNDLFKWYIGATSPRMTLSDTQLSMTSTTDSTSVSTGSIVTTGGMGIAKKLYVGTNINTRSLTVSGVVDLANRTISGNANFGLIYSANVGAIASHLFCSVNATTEYIKINSFTAMLEVLGISQFTGAITSTSTTASTSNTEGSLKLSGGIGISNTTDATSSVIGGTITTAGGAAIAKKLYVGTDLYINNIEIPRFHNGTFSAASSAIIPIYFGETQYNYAEIKIKWSSSIDATDVNFVGNSDEAGGGGTDQNPSEQRSNYLTNTSTAHVFQAQNSYKIAVNAANNIDSILTLKIIRGNRCHFEYTTVYTYATVGATRLEGQGYLNSGTRSIKITPASGTISGAYSTIHSY